MDARSAGKEKDNPHPPPITHWLLPEYSKFWINNLILCSGTSCLDL